MNTQIRMWLLEFSEESDNSAILFYRKGNLGHKNEDERAIPLSNPLHIKNKQWKPHSLGLALRS